MEELPKWKHDLSKTPHKLLNDPFNVLVEYYKEHLRRDTADGRLTPTDAWIILRGFLIAAAQTYASICFLVASKRPKPFMLQANVLTRALFEILASVLTLTEAPADRAKILSLEAWKVWAVRLEYLTRRFGTDPKWVEYLEVYRKGLGIMAKAFGVSAEAQTNPESITESWPTPGVMLRHQPPFVSGSRHAVLKEIYDFHYPMQSAQAHARLAALGAAMLVDTPEQQWNPGHGESSTATSALLFVACILSEIESAGTYTRHPKLAELWTYLRDLDDEAKELWALRYEELEGNAESQV